MTRCGVSGILVVCLSFWGMTLPVQSLAEEDWSGWRMPVPDRPSPTWSTVSMPFSPAGVLDATVGNQEVTARYLRTLAEFSPDLALCAPEARRETVRTRIAQRLRDFNELIEQLRREPAAVSNRQVERIVSQFDDGFRRLRELERSAGVVFVTGLSFSTALPHLDGARNAARVGILRVQRHCREGRIDEAIADVESLMALSRDVRPRGFVISQMVSVGIDSVILGQMIPEILDAEATHAKHCDQLMKILARHQRESLDPFQEAVRMDYVMVRRMLEDLERREGDFAPAGLRRLGLDEMEGLPVVLTRLLGQPADSPLVEQLDQRLQEMNTEQYQRELQTMTESTRTLLQLEMVPFRQFSEAVIDVEVSRVERAPLAAQLDTGLLAVGRAAARWRAQMAGTQCLLALRRFEKLYPEERPRTLLQAVRSAGGRQVPVDVYSGEPMKMAEVEGQLVVYSVGVDGVDQRGLEDWAQGRQPGDFRFGYRMTEAAAGASRN